MLTEKWPVLGRHEQAAVWLQIWTDLGRAPRTIDAYARGLAEYLVMCEREDVGPVTANRAHIALYVRELTSRPHRRGANVVAIDYGAGLANATIQQRLVPVRLFYDFLMEEGLRESNPVGRGRYTPGRQRGGQQRGLVPRLTKLPWIPSEQQWLGILQVAREEPVRNRVMLALAYDSALRREELCSLRTDDLDPAHRMLRVRAETTKNRLERVVLYSASTGVLMSAYLAHRATVSRARGPLFLSESRRNHGQPLTLWTWSKVVHRIALEAGVPRFSTHTTRHLCLTDLARMGWELHAIATFAGHRNTDSTLQYIHLSGRDLADKLARGCNVPGPHVHVQRRDNANGAWSKSRKRWAMPVDFLVVQAFDQYFDERFRVLGTGGSDFLLVNLFRAPLGAPMPPDAVGELCERLTKRAKLSRKVGPHMARRAWERRVIVWPKVHPVLGMPDCQVPDCTKRTQFGRPICEGCFNRRRASGLSPEEFMKIARPAVFRNVSQELCLVRECRRPWHSAPSKLCDSHLYQRRRLTLGLEEFVLRPSVEPVPSFGECRVAACYRQRYSGRLLYCTSHQRSPPSPHGSLGVGDNTGLLPGQ